MRRRKGQDFKDFLEEEQRTAILEQDRTLAAAKVRDITDEGTGSHTIIDTTALGMKHTTSGLTAGQVFRATGPTTAAMQRLQEADISGMHPEVHNHASHSGIGPNDHHDEAHTIASHSDTSATGSQLDTVTDGSEVDTLHAHPGTFYIPIASESEDGITIAV